MSQDTVKPDRPWMMRTYSGHSSARASNQLYRTNLSRGQTGLSVAFDLPTQTGYDSDHPLARGEVGKVGVPINHIEDMEALFDQIPLDQMNTSMTINATAPWLLALYIAVAERQGVDPRNLQGTTQNDVLKEYLSRGTYIYPPGPSVRLTTDLISYTVEHIPKWNPTNICSYHLQEAGATPTQELAYALSSAIAILDAVQSCGQIPVERRREPLQRPEARRHGHRIPRQGPRLIDGSGRCEHGLPDQHLFAEDHALLVDLAAHNLDQYRLGDVDLFTPPVGIERVGPEDRDQAQSLGKRKRIL